MPEERTQYREWTPWPGWVKAILWGAVVLSCYPLLAGWDTDLPFGIRAVIVVGVVAVATVAKYVLGGLTVLVQETRILVHLGSVRLVSRRVPFSEIVSTKAVQYGPIREFGGWGVRRRGKRKVWSARGNRAVLLTLTDDRELLIGSDHPQRLQERIRAAMDEPSTDEG